jgi:hypothetical protein
MVIVDKRMKVLIDDIRHTHLADMGMLLLERCIADHAPGYGVNVISTIRSKQLGAIGWEEESLGIYWETERVEPMSEQGAS